MIRNLIYSILVHLILFLLIYTGFKIQVEDGSNLTQISVNIASEAQKESEEIVQPNKEEDSKKKIEENPKKEEKKEEKKPKEVKEEPKKIEETAKKAEEIKKKPEKEVKKKEIIEKKPEPEKKEEKLIKKEPETEKKEEKPLKKEEEKTEKQEEQKKEPDKTEEESKKYYINGSEQEITKTIELSGLSAREKLNLKSQINRCYAKALRASNKVSNVSLLITLQVSKSGYIETDLNQVIDSNLYETDEQYKIAVDNARLTVEFCNPLRSLPRDKFHIWKNIAFEFKGMN